jgi:hypothetical protein
VTATELVLIGIVVLVVLAAAFALVGGLASWAVASRTVDRLVRDVKRQPDTRDAFVAAVDEAVLLTHELADEEEPEEAADDFVSWEAELAVRPGIAKHLRRMERWSK